MQAYWVSYMDNTDESGGKPITFDEKPHGEAITLTDIVPTRFGYIFKGWSTSPSATTVEYLPGASYTDNASITLYAVWEVGYIKPRIKDVAVMRCDSDGNFSDEGTYFKASFSWETNIDVSSISVKWKPTTIADAWTTSYVSATGTSGTVTDIFGGNNITIDSSYNVRITVTDTKDSNYIIRLIPGKAYAIDFLNGGTGVAFGKPAELTDYIDSNFKAKFRQDVTIDGKIFDRFGTEIQNGLAAYETDGINADTTLEHLILTNYNTPNSDFMYVKTDFYNSKSTTSNRMQTAFPSKNTQIGADMACYFRYYNDGAWGKWVRFGEGIMDPNGIYYGEDITLTNMTWSGFVSNSSKSVVFTIPLGRPIHAQNMEFSGTLVIRGIKGYIDQATYSKPLTIGASGYTVNVISSDDERKSGLIRCEIIRNTAFTNITNNTPISVTTHYTNPLVISFNDGWNV